MLGTRIVTNVISPNPNLPSVPMPSLLTGISGCLAAWEFRSRSDATGNVGLLPTGLTWTSEGLVIPGGTFAGIATGLKPASPLFSIVLAAKPASDISTGYFLGSVASASGFGVTYDTDVTGVKGLVIKSDGSSAVTTGTTQPANEWFAVAISVNTTQVNGTSDSGSAISSATYTAGSLVAPTKEIFIGSRDGVGSGVHATLGCLAFYDHYLVEADRIAAIDLARQVMAARGVTIPS